MKKSKSKSLTSSPNQMEMVVLAVFVCGGSTNLVETEDVAVKANEIAPGRFNWRKYTDQINLELIRVFLSDAKKPKNGSLVAGDGRTGWSLTPKGLAWAHKNLDRLSENHRRPPTKRGGGGISEMRQRRERDRLLESGAWASWKQGSGVIDDAGARALFRIDGYTSPRSVELKINRLKELFETDPELSRFIESAARQLMQRTS